MSVEQTTQLIQLILNSMLMIVACALLLSRITTRQAALEESLQAANRQCLELLGLSGEPKCLDVCVYPCSKTTNWLELPFCSQRWSESSGADRSFG